MKTANVLYQLCLLTVVVLVSSAEAQVHYCLQPYPASITCQAGSCRGRVTTYVASLPFQTVLWSGPYGRTQYCCGAQIPVDSLFICPGPQPLKLERGELEQLVETFGGSRVFVPVCRGGYQSLQRLGGTREDGGSGL
jgi:hypothetical protein